MKKLLALVLLLCMTFSLSGCAFFLARTMEETEDMQEEIENFAEEIEEEYEFEQFTEENIDEYISEAF